MFWHKVIAELLREENIGNVGARWDGKMLEMLEQGWSGKTSEQGGKENGIYDKVPGSWKQFGCFADVTSST